MCVDTTPSATGTTGSSSGPPNPSTTSLETASTSTSTSTLTSDGTTIAATLDPTSSSTGLGSTSTDSSSTGSVTLDPDLVAWYRFDTLDNGVVPDSAGNGHDATCQECPALIDGVFGSAVELSGAEQFFTVPDDPAFWTETWALAAWIWMDDPTMLFRTVVGKPVGIDTANSFEIGVLTTSNTTVRSGWSDDTLSQSSVAPLPGFGQWVHVVAMRSDRTGSLYLDGELVDEEAATVVPAFDGQDVYIGADVDDQVIENFFIGRIDDLRVYRRALTGEEIAVIMAGDNL